MKSPSPIVRFRRIGRRGKRVCRGQKNIGHRDLPKNTVWFQHSPKGRQYLPPRCGSARSGRVAQASGGGNTDDRCRPTKYHTPRDWSRCRRCRQILWGIREYPAGRSDSRESAGQSLRIVVWRMPYSFQGEKRVSGFASAARTGDHCAIGVRLMCDQAGSGAQAGFYPAEPLLDQGENSGLNSRSCSASPAIHTTLSAGHIPYSYELR